MVNKKRVRTYRVGRYVSREDTECACGSPIYRGEHAYAYRDYDGQTIEAGFCVRFCAQAAAAEAYEEARSTRECV